MIILSFVKDIFKVRLKIYKPLNCRRENMVTNHKIANIEKHKLALQKTRTEIINSTPEKALDIIISSHTPAKLVQSFPDEDLYFLVHHIGIADAIQILALATSDQWGYMLDVETWGKDRLDMRSVTEWLKILLVADNKRTVRWMLNERLEFIELYLLKNIEVIIREENEDPSDFADDFFTYDDYFYVRIIENPTWAMSEDGSLEDSAEERQITIRAFIESLVSINITLYQNVLLESTGVVPAEVEEEEYRMRNVRLSEKGFMSYDDALEIYSPLTPDYFDSKDEKLMSAVQDPESAVNVPVTYISDISIQNNFTKALAFIENEKDLEILRMEFAALCNQVISADKGQVSERKELQRVVDKACGYVHLGLEVLSEETKRDLSVLVMAFGLKDLFRLGYGLVMDLKWRAERFKKNSWFVEKGLPLSFWGEQWVGTLGGLLVDRPLYYDNYETGVLYRDFKTSKDMEKTSKSLETIKYFDDLLSLIGPNIEAFSENFLTSYNLLLTLWVNNLAGKDLRSSGPVEIEVLRKIFELLWEPGQRDIENPGQIKISVKEDFLSWLSSMSGFSAVEIAERMGDGLEAMFLEIEKEYSCVQAKDLDPKYIYLFCVND